MAFTAQDVKELREKTSCGMMDCKKALAASDGDMEKAVDFLREKGLAAATKKAGRVAAEGVAYAIATEKAGVIIEVNAETDFVAKNASFQEFVETCAKTVLEQNPADVDALLACTASGKTATVDAELKDRILTIGENIKVRRFERIEGVVADYIHAGGKIAVLVSFDADEAVAAKPEFKEFARNVGMQVAAMNPSYLDRASVPAEVVEHEQKIATEQAAGSGKPANVVEKMVEGKVNKILKETCLVDQVYVKDGNLTVQKYAEETGKALGGKIVIKGFVRYEKGEGIEKRQDNFAEEIASMVK